MMQKYSYKARNSSGKPVSGKIEAESRNKAIAFLKGRKLFIVEIKESSPGGVLRPGAIWGNRVSARELAIMCRQFAVMTRAGVPILQSLNIIICQCDNKALKETLKKVVGSLEGGMSLAETVKAHPHVFPRIFTSMIEAGEVSGALDDVLDRLADNFEKEHDLKEKVKSAMTYPLIIAMVAVFAVAALMVFVVPKFIVILDDMKVPIPLSTQLIIIASDITKRYWFIALLSAVGAVFGYSRAVGTERGARIKDRVVLNFPVCGPLVRKVIISRF